MMHTGSETKAVGTGTERRHCHLSLSAAAKSNQISTVRQRMDQSSSAPSSSPGWNQKGPK